jgi:hypothetical protein
MLTQALIAPPFFRHHDGGVETSEAVRVEGAGARRRDTRSFHFARTLSSRASALLRSLFWDWAPWPADHPRAQKLSGI